MVLALLNIAKIYLLYLVHQEIKKDKAIIRQEWPNQYYNL